MASVRQRQTAQLVLRIARNRIHFLKFILEAYDGMALLSVLNARDGLVVVRFAPENGLEVVELLASLAAGKNLK